MDPDVHDWTLATLAEALANQTISSVEATQACLARVEATQDLNAFVYVDAEGALKQAQASDERRARHAERGPLDGIPIALKDNFLTQGLPTTCASRMLQNFTAPYDATSVRLLKEAGMVLLGKLNMDEFAMGSSSEHSAFGPIRNPWDPRRVPGGSSGGSAVAVAVGSAFASLGTDTGGSIRQPAALSGIVGLKPTYGLVSRYGVVAFASSLDQVGPMTKDVTDCALLLQVIAGYDPRDSTSSREPVPSYQATLEDGVQGLKLGIPQEYFHEGMDPEVRQWVDKALDVYQSLGAEVVEVTLPHTEHSIAPYYVIASAEASSNLARYDGVRYGQRTDTHQGLLEMYLSTRAHGFGPEVKRRILLGTYVLSSGYYEAYYGRAQKVRTLVKQDFDQAFLKVDALVTPTSPTVAFLLDDKTQDPVQMYLADVFTVAANLAGLPGISLPCGFTEARLPVGLQLLGAPWQEAKLLRMAWAYEQDQPWHQWRVPAV